jgi:hypothetical protein
MSSKRVNKVDFMGSPVCRSLFLCDATTKARVAGAVPGVHGLKVPSKLPLVIPIVTGKMVTREARRYGFWA